MLDPKLMTRLHALDFDFWNAVGGQHLILPDIMAALSGINSIYMPIPCPLLSAECIRQGILETPVSPEAIYFGTPTIVNDRVLFPAGIDDPDSWSKDFERGWVRSNCKRAIKAGVKRIVSGLGSGDISVDERLADMGGGGIAVFKDFGEFQDWVLVRNL